MVVKTKFLENNSQHHFSNHIYSKDNDVHEILLSLVSLNQNLERNEQKVNDIEK